MNRQQKIDLLKAIAAGERSVKELKIRNDLIICDEKDVGVLGNVTGFIVTKAEYESLEKEGLVKGFVIDWETKSIIQHN
jgi:hypothetical protein